MTAETGPYETERDAEAAVMPQQINAMHRGNLVRSGDPDGLVRGRMHQALVDALAAAGVEVGAYDWRVLEWLCGWEPTTVQVVVGLIARAHAAGVDAGAGGQHDGGSTR